MKKIAMILMIALILVVISAAALADTMYATKSIKLYNGNDEAICTIPYGAAVETHTRSLIDANRMEVGYNGNWGWVYSDYLSAFKPAQNNSKSSTKTTTTVSNVFSGMKAVDPYYVIVRPTRTNGYVNLRWAPSTSAEVHGIRYNGDVLKVIAKNKTWAQVIDEGTGECGFMMLSFTEKAN